MLLSDANESPKKDGPMELATLQETTNEYLLTATRLRVATRNSNTIFLIASDPSLNTLLDGVCGWGYQIQSIWGHEKVEEALNSGKDAALLIYDYCHDSPEHTEVLRVLEYHVNEVPMIVVVADFEIGAYIRSILPGVPLLVRGFFRGGRPRGMEIVSAFLGRKGG
jgi:hypothetical protein